MIERVYILLKRKTEDYSNLPPAFDHVFLFDEPEVRVPNFHMATARLKARYVKCDEAYSCDRIIINGPAWLNAIAGHFWFGMHSTTSQLIFDSKRNVYIDHDYELPELFT